jgi:hypothetical protein
MKTNYQSKSPCCMTCVWHTYLSNRKHMCTKGIPAAEVPRYSEEMTQQQVGEYKNRSISTRGICDDWEAGEFYKE